ncbi:MAG: hypothetical protein K8I60_14465, partial [Anaerolineae bacterium]|nr:hypothetical protein [Anaerolineae bacterium]
MAFNGGVMMSKRVKPAKKVSPRSRPVSQGIDVKGIILWIIRLPRLLRIVMVALFAAAFTFAANPLVDEIYLKFFFNDATREAPAIVAVAIGMASYAVGWFLVVGTAG